MVTGHVPTLLLQDDLTVLQPCDRTN